jgi:ABC-type transport system involved in cytochrome c biogenesis permease component
VSQHVRRSGPARVAAPTWRIVCAQELRDLWIGGKALYLMLIYAVLLGIYAYLFASNAELNLLPQNEVVLEIVKASIVVGVFICLTIGADSFSGERERATLESLLLTPTSRRQIVVGKFLAAVSPWPVAPLIAVPYWIVLAKGDPVLGPTALWALVLGTLLAPAFAGIGMLVSIWCNSNKTSMLVSLGLFLLLVLPAGFGPTERGVALHLRSDFLQWVNPMAATARLLQATAVTHSSMEDVWAWMTTPVLFPIVVLTLLIMLAGPGLRLDAGSSRLWSTPT